MEKLEVIGAKKLKGNIKISGSKNSSLPILAATLLSNKKVKILNLPKVKDIETMLLLLRSLGSKIKLNKKNKSVDIDNSKNIKIFASYNLVKTMRAGILVLGPLLARFGQAKISLPGGCAIGARPVDIHLKALSKLGVKYKIVQGYIYAKATKGLIGNTIKFPKISVGATENVLIAASYAQGKTKIKNCACEPEVKDLVNFLKKMGCDIRWTGKRSLEVVGVNKLLPTKYKIIFDRIEAGTYIIASALTRGKIKITNLDPSIMKSELSALTKMGLKISKLKKMLIVSPSSKIKSINLKTEPYPGFPTDLQAQIMVLMTMAKGISTITENIFENRFMHVSELNRMGANITVKNNKAIIYGPQQFNGAELMATDLRASVSLVLAGLIGKNKTVVNRIYHLDRGYENLELKLSSCGASIKRLRDV